MKFNQLSTLHFSRILILTATFLALSAVITSAFADVPYAEVGTLTAEGTVKLDINKFRDTFSNGSSVVELKAIEYKGFHAVRRKGYSDEGSCRAEIAYLQDENGNRIASDNLNGVTRVRLNDEPVAIDISNCSDVGCSGRCDITELSNNRCACHVRIFDHTEAFRDPELCRGLFDVGIFHLGKWVILSSIIN